MKNTAKTAALIITVLALMATAWVAGRNSGIQHAMEDAEVWLANTGYETTVYIDLDDATYAHTAYIG